MDELTAEATVSDIERLFEVWGIIQKELVDMSQFYSLIDIYGHYANRGDTVKVVTEIKSHSESTDNSLNSALNYFGNSEHCGIYLSRDNVAENIGIKLDEVDSLVSRLREAILYGIVFKHLLLMRDAVAFACIIIITG